jgi:RNA polymerase sigma factor (sigma-70 family)
MVDLTQIIKDCVDGKKQAQFELYKILLPKLMSVCTRYTGSKYEAEDYLQDSFIKIFSNIKDYKGNGPIEAWARRIAVNIILKEFQKKSPLKKSLELDEIQEPADEKNDILSDLRHSELLSFINCLPESKKIIFNLYVIEGYTHKEISQLLKISEGTSKSQLSRAKEMLAQIHKKHNSSL